MKRTLPLDRLARAERDIWPDRADSSSCASFAESGISASSSIRPSRAMRKYGVARRPKSRRGEWRAGARHASNRRAECHARLAHLHLVDRWPARRASEGLLRSWRLPCGSVQAAACENGAFLSRADSARSSWLRRNVDDGFLRGERGFGLRDLRLQQRVVELAIAWPCFTQSPSST